MKKNFIGIVTVVAALGFSAFSPESYKAKNGLTTYFAIRQSAGHWTWETSVPTGLDCLDEIGGPTCTYDAAQKPADDSNPGGTSNKLYK